MDSDDVSMGDIDKFKQKEEAKQASSGGDELSSLFEKIKGLCNEDVVSSNQAVYQFNVIDHGEWFLDLKTGSGTQCIFCITGKKFFPLSFKRFSVPEDIISQCRLYLLLETASKIDVNFWFAILIQQA